jgi:TonB family protein
MLLCPALESLAQAKHSSETQEQHVVLSKLSPPIYPPLARQARISGDVGLELRIRQDGSIESTQLASGHPMLSGAALDSAKKSEFECHSCPEGLTRYSLIYTFALTTGENCCKLTESSDGKEHRLLAGVYQSEGHVTIIAEPTCICDPSASIRKVRSAKCLYLWRCGLL